jgi:nucleoside-diphosphate-sugar epimerase
MRIAVLGATSQIAKDLILSFSTQEDHHLNLFARRPDCVKKWLDNVGLAERYVVDEFGGFGAQEFDVIINFVGVGNPAQTAAMGASIYDVTLQYDELALNYVRHHPECRYVFLSSGAAYGSCFNSPVDVGTKGTIDINNLQPQDWYGVAKLYAECRHRAHPELPIIDIRVFNYFSRTQDMSARFLITDIVRAIRDNSVLQTSAEYMVRDFIGPSDFYQLIQAILTSPANNDVLDCYSKAPIDKPTLLTAMQDRFGLKYEISKTNASVNATGSKSHYFSLNDKAKNYGYHPALSSIDSILIEAESLING